MILEMKRFFSVAIVILAFGFIFGCDFQRPYMAPIIEEAGPNETAFLVALEGDSKTNQAKMDSIDLY